MASGRRQDAAVPTVRPSRATRTRDARVNMTSKLAQWRAPVLVVAALLAGLAACGHNPTASKQRALARGEQYLKDGKVNEAIIELRNAVQVHKNFVPALHALGRAYLAKSWFADAVRELA